MRIVFVGGSGGIGKPAVEKLDERGHEVLVIDEEEAEFGGSVDFRKADITETSEIEFLENEEVDALVNCAGYQRQGSVEDMELELFEEHMDVNYLGAVDVIKRCITSLKQNNGRIVNVASVAGRMTMPYLGAYSASKHALEALSDSLRMELEQFDVDVVVVEPGPVRTGFNEEAMENLKNYPESDYSEEYEKRLEKGFGGIKPEKAAETVVKAVETGSPKTRYRPTWKTRLLISVEKFLPQTIFDMIAKKQ